MGSKQSFKRHERVASSILVATSKVFSRLHLLDSCFENLNIVCRFVKVSPDLRICWIYIGLLFGGDIDSILKILDRYKPRIRSMLAEEVTLRFFPEIRFTRETKSENALRVCELLNTLKTDEPVE